MPRCCNCAPRTKLPPPITTATCTPLRTTSAICRATRCTTSGSRPTSPPPNISPPSLRSTREYIGRIGGATPLVVVGSAIRLLHRSSHEIAIPELAGTASPILPHSGHTAAMGSVPERLAEMRREQPGAHRLAAVRLVADVGAAERLKESGVLLWHVRVDASGPDLVDLPVLGHHFAQLV